MNPLQEIYRKLLKHHGPQGWWPVKGKYHPNDFSYPRNSGEIFEICVGAILTQNTAWTNVEKALENLRKSKLLSPQNIIEAGDEELREALRPSGYFNQKAKKLRLFAAFFRGLKKRTPTREELLALWGIGPETADSILLYAYKQPEFVVDAYTKRIFKHKKLIKADWDYEKIKNFFETKLEPDYKIFQEYHALIVEHAKNYYNHKRSNYDDPL